MLLAVRNKKGFGPSEHVHGKRLWKLSFQGREEPTEFEGEAVDVEGKHHEEEETQESIKT